VFVVGYGARHDMEPITRLAERLGAPVLTTFKAKGQISDHHPLGAGVLGRSATPVASYLMNESEVLVVWGASFSNHTGIAPYKPIIQVDDDPMAIGRYHPVGTPILGDVGVTASAITAGLPGRVAAVDQRVDVAERWTIWRGEKRARIADDRGHGVGSAAVFDALGRHVASDAVICVDVGNNAYSFGRYFEVESQSVLMSGYLGSIRFALPAAMGAWAAVGDHRQIVAVAGDGGFGRYAMELTTAVRHDMDLTVVLLDNSELGKISKEQRAGQFDVWQTALVNLDFADFARLCGAFAVSATTRPISTPPWRPLMRGARSDPFGDRPGAADEHLVDGGAVQVVRPVADGLHCDRQDQLEHLRVGVPGLAERGDVGVRRVTTGVEQRTGHPDERRVALVVDRTVVPDRVGHLDRRLRHRIGDEAVRRHAVVTLVEPADREEHGLLLGRRES